MAFKVLALFCLLLVISSASPVLKSDTVGPAVVHATGNASVPSVDYIVNAVQSLKQSLDVFPDASDTAKLYAALFKTLYPERTWNVVVGYSTLYINSSVYVEVSVSNGKQSNGKSKGDKGSKDTLFMIFSSN